MRSTLATATLILALSAHAQTPTGGPVTPPETPPPTGPPVPGEPPVLGVRQLIVGEVVADRDGAVQRMTVVPFDEPNKRYLLTTEKYAGIDAAPPPRPRDLAIPYSTPQGTARGVLVLGYRTIDSRGAWIWNATVIAELPVLDALRAWLEWRDAMIGRYFHEDRAERAPWTAPTPPVLPRP